MNQRIIKIGVDLDGVIARHSLGGFWVILRKLKERLLKTTHSQKWYYPSTFLEKFAWKVINWLRIPFADKDGFFASLAGGNKAKFYLVTSRFKFLEKLTADWLKKYHLDQYFAEVLINNKDINPLIFKTEIIKERGLDFFIDDDLEVIDYLKKNIGAKLFWVVPGHKDKKDNNHHDVGSGDDFTDILRKLFPKVKPRTG